MTPAKIREVFAELCTGYADRIDAYDTVLDTRKKCTVFTILYSSIKAELVYVEKGNSFVPSSTLYCRIYPQKNRDISIIMPSVFPYAGIKEFRACVFPHIENTERMTACFTALTAILDEHLPQLEYVFSDPDEVVLKTWLVNESGVEDTEMLLSGNETAVKAFAFSKNFLEDCSVAKFAIFDGYYYFLNGDIKKALKYYRKENRKGRLSLFETELLCFIESLENKSFSPIFEDCFAWKASRPYSSGKVTQIILFKSMLLIFGVSAVVCCLMSGVLGMAMSKDTICFFGAPWYFGFICAGIPGVFGGIALFRELAPVVHKKNVSEQLEFDEIMNRPWVYKLAKMVFVISVVAALVFAVAISLMPLRLYDTYGDIPDPASNSLFQKRIVFRYEDIDKIYYIEGRYNVYGDYIERPSYVIGMMDGTAIDFDGYASVKAVKRDALPLFEKLDIELVYVNSDRDVPGMTEYFGE